MGVKSKIIVVIYFSNYCRCLLGVGVVKDLPLIVKRISALPEAVYSLLFSPFFFLHPPFLFPKARAVIYLIREESLTVLKPGNASWTASPRALRVAQSPGSHR